MFSCFTQLLSCSPGCPGKLFRVLTLQSLLILWEFNVNFKGNYKKHQFYLRKMTFRTVRLGRTERDKGVRQTLSFKPRVPNLEFLVQNKSDGNVIQSLDFGRTKPLGSRGFNAAKCPCTSFLRDIPAWKGSRGFLLGGENQGADPWGSAGSSAPWGVPENPSKVVQLRWKSQLCGFGLQLLLAALLRVGAPGSSCSQDTFSQMFYRKKTPCATLGRGQSPTNVVCGCGVGRMEFGF